MKPYQKLVNDGDKYAMPVDVYDTWTFSDSGRESVSVLTAETEPGKFVAGWRIFWNDGRCSLRAPSLRDGWFDSLRDAKLYVLSMFAEHIGHFTPDSREVIKKELCELQQYTLF